MRFLFTTSPGLGHVYPMVPVARGLIERGHRVRFAMASRMVPELERLGLEAVPAGLDWHESAAAEAFPRLSSLPLAHQSFYFLRDIFAEQAAVAMVPDLVEAARQWRPDVVVHDNFDFAAGVAAERLDLPHATLGAGLYLPPSVTKRHLGRSLARLRARFSLPPDPEMERLDGQVHVTFAPKGFELPGVPLPPAVRAVRPTFFDHPPGLAVPSWLDRGRERPTVYATLGTVFNRTPGVFATVLEALADLPITLVLTIGFDQRPESLGALPPNVVVEHFVPNSLMVPRCDLMVTNGSYRSVLLAFTHGVPLVLVPLSSDEPLNAVRCRELGVAQGLEHPRAHEWFRYLRVKDLPPFSAATLREAVSARLARPPRAALDRVRAEMASLPPPERAVELLECAALPVERRA